MMPPFLSASSSDITRCETMSPTCVPADTAGLALLGDDLNHSRRCLGAVQRRGRRPLDHFDRFDVVRINGVERRCVLSEDGVVALTSAVDTHAIDVNRWVVAGVERTGAA